MKNKNTVAWGMIISISIAILTGIEFFGEEGYSIAGLGILVFGIWSSIILLNHKI